MTRSTRTPADPAREGAAMTDQAWLGLTDDDGYRIQKRLHALLAAGWPPDRVADLLKSAYDHDIASSCGYMQGVREAERDFRPPPPKSSRWKRLRRRLRR